MWERRRSKTRPLVSASSIAFVLRLNVIDMKELQLSGTNDFAENPEPRCPCVLLLDTSGSMTGDPINELNAGLLTYKDELAADSLAAKRVKVVVLPAHT